MSNENRITVERDWEKLREDVNDCIDRLEESWNDEEPDMSDEELEDLDARYTGLVKLLALFCGGVDALIPEPDDKTPEDVLHEKLFQVRDKSSEIH